MGVGVDGQATQREAPERFKVDRSTVMHICKVAKQGALDALSASVPGRPGQSLEAVALADARKEIERLRATVTEQAVALHLHEGKARWDSPPARSLARVDAVVKAGLLDLVDHAGVAGWTTRLAEAGLGDRYIGVEVSPKLEH